MAVAAVYDQLRDQTFREVAPWYAQSSGKCILKIAGLCALFLLPTSLITGGVGLVGISFGGVALALPLSSIGTIGHQLIGSTGLITAIAIDSVITVTAVGSVIGSSAAVLFSVTYRVKAHFINNLFLLANHTEEDKGFLYAIKNNEERVLGYLYGTTHVMPKSWEGLNDQVTSKLNESDQVFVECYDVPRHIDWGMKLMKLRLGLDFELMDYARDNNLELTQFETYTQHMNKLRNANALASRHPQGEKNPNFVNKLPSQDIDMRIWAWQLGDADKVQALLDTGENEYDSCLYHYLLNVRNNEWMPVIVDTLNARNDDPDSSPCFIAVGHMHLFDLPSARNTVGLISLIKNAGWTVERVEDDQASIS